MVLTPEEACKGLAGKQTLEGDAGIFERDLDASLAERRGRLEFYSLNYYRAMPACPKETAMQLFELYQKAGWKVVYHPQVQGRTKLHSDFFTFHQDTDMRIL